MDLDQSQTIFSIA